MASATYQLQGSSCTAPSKPLPWWKGVKLRQFGVSLQCGSANVRSFDKSNLGISVGTPRNLVIKKKSSKISAFKAYTQNDESEIRASSSKSAKRSLKLTYLHQNNKETPVKSLNVPNVPLPFASEVKSVVGLPAVHKLFRKWLTVLVSLSPNEGEEVLFEKLPEKKGATPEIPYVEQKKDRAAILQEVWCYFLSLDAAIKLPLVIFIPLYLAVCIAYGTKVTRDLTPLWIFGPLVVAFNVKMAHWIAALYIFTFNQSAMFLKKIPLYMQTAHAFISQGGIQATIYSRLVKPILEIKNTDFKQLLRQKQQQYQEWSTERFLDFAEQIWPFYSRIVRFLKRSNLI